MLEQRLGTFPINTRQENEHSDSPDGKNWLKLQTKSSFISVQQLQADHSDNLEEIKSTSDGGLALMRKPMVSDGGRAELLKPMYELAMEGLFIISRVLASAEIARLYGRLKVWGSGLFHGTYDLTKMLAQYPDYSTDADEGQCGVFHKSFISILLEIEQILIIFQSGNDAIEDFQTRLSMFLQDDTPLQNEILKSTLLQSESMANKPEKGISGYLRRVEDELDSLFMLLRAVQSLRDIYQPPQHAQLEMVD